MIEGIKITPLRVLPDERGSILHMLKNTDEHFERFGEIYFSTVYQGAIKAWHLHSEMTLNYAVPMGMIKLALYDDREGSPTRGQVNEIFVGDRNYVLVTVPPLVWNGFKGISSPLAIVANCATVPHRPDEIQRISPFDTKIAYDWSIKHG